MAKQKQKQKQYRAIRNKSHSNNEGPDGMGIVDYY